MNILLVVPDTSMGGITSAAVNFCNEMIKRGHSVTFLDMSCGEEPSELSGKVVVEHLYGEEVFWNITSKHGCGLPWILHKILGLIKKMTVRSGLWYKIIFRKAKNIIPYDVAIAFRQCAPCYFYVLKKTNAKLRMAFVHGELTYMGDISSWQKYMSAFDKVAYVSDAVRTQFISRYPYLEKNACTIYNMFSAENILKMSGMPCNISFDNEKTNIATVARIENEFKQIHWIVDVCARLKAENVPPFHWYVIGDGPDYEETIQLSIEKKVDDVLTFLGGQNNPFNIVKQANFTVSTSKSEAYGMAVVESLILKKPIIVAEYPAIYEIMENRKHGLIAHQSVESLTECILQFLNNDDEIFSLCSCYIAQCAFSNDVPYHQLLTALKQ